MQGERSPQVPPSWNDNTLPQDYGCTSTRIRETAVYYDPTRRQARRFLRRLHEDREHGWKTPRPRSYSALNDPGWRGCSRTSAPREPPTGTRRTRPATCTPPRNLSRRRG